MAKKSKKVSDSIDLSRKKKKEFDVETNIKVAYKTGKIIYGKSQVLRQIRQQPFKMLILSDNCPAELENQLDYMNKLSDKKSYIYKYKGSSWELGLALGKPYMISVIGVNNFGDSALMSLITKHN